MKTIICIFCFFFAIGLSLFAQQDEVLRSINNQSKVGEPSEAIIKTSTVGLSPYTAFLIADIKNIEMQGRKLSINDSILINKYSLHVIDNELYVNSFLHVSEDFSIEELRISGFLPGVYQGNIVSGLIPVFKIEEFLMLESVKYIKIGEPVSPQLDNASNSTWTNWVHQGYQLPQSYFGNGVVVGIIDQGFDYTHPNFFDALGNNYRIKRVWEQNATIGTPPSGFSYGRELSTQTTILNAQRDVINVSHGTHVTGIAAGSGSAASSYMGIAPQSDIVLVSYKGLDPYISDGVSYIMNYANSVGGF